MLERAISTFSNLPERDRRSIIGITLWFFGSLLLAIAAYIFWRIFGEAVNDWPAAVAFILTIVGSLVYGSIFQIYGRNKNRALEKIEKLEDRARENPAPLTAWDLARGKLENYLDRNLIQVNSIYRMVVLIILIGFTILSFGIWKSFSSPSLGPSIIASASGIIIQFIGATFLVIFKSTMAQAKDYVQVLERINAVGMSIQILESIEGTAPSTRNKVRAELARDLLHMYGSKSGEKSIRPINPDAST